MRRSASAIVSACRDSGRPFGAAGQTALMAEPWRWAATRRDEFDAEAVAYDKYRPRYPEELFDAVVRALGRSDATVLEIGAGTGIASEPLARRGLNVIAIEPAPAMATIARSKLGNRGQVIDSSFEDASLPAPVDGIAAFSSWHWVNPAVGVAKVASLLRPGGALALTWTEVQQWGAEPFDRLSGYEDTRMALASAIEPCLRPIDDHGGFSEREVLRFRFERALDADTFVALARTYPGPHSDAHDKKIRSLINDDFGGTVIKVEDAVLHLFTRT